MPFAPMILPRARRRAVLSAVAVVATTASVLSVATLAAPPAHAALPAFTPDDVVVYRVGSGAAALSSVATAAFFDEVSPTGTAVQSLPLPTAASGANKTLTNSGTATSEGLLTLSPNGQFLTAAGYNAPVGTAGVANTASASTSRTVAIVGTNGVVDTSTSLTDAHGGNNVRSAATVDGTAVWTAGANNGVRYAVKGAGTSTQISDTSTGAVSNVRQVQVVNGQLYATSQSGTTRVATVGNGTPTTSGQTVTNLPGAIATTPNPYGVAFLTLGTGTSPDTAYVTDNTAGAVLKYSLVNGSWNATGSVSGLSGVTGVTANIYDNAVRIYATTALVSGSGLYQFVDTSGKGGTLSGAPGAPIVTAAANTSFRGVAFAPGTTIKSGLTTTPVAGNPTVATTPSALAAALGDPTNPTLGATVAIGTNATYTAGQLTVTASSSNTTVAPNNGISVTGTGVNRTVSVTPGAVGVSTITLTVTAPDGKTGTTAFTYGVSASQGSASDRYLAGAGNASAAVAVGNGYAVVGDDESDVIRLYDTANSGLPVNTFDFTTSLPFGNAEVDIEGAARAGNTIYWMGSMSTNSSGAVAPARSTLFATTVAGTGANTTLTYAGANTNLQTDLVNWDKNNGHGLGANYFGFDSSVNGGIANHANNAFNLEGLEFAQGSTTTAYLAFRAPIVPASNRTKALLVPVTNFTQLVSGNAVHGTFGAPIQWNLGGLGVRDIKANADGTYVVIAGTADGSNSSFVLYTWDGNPADPPLPGQSLSPVAQGAWEAIVSVPSPLTASSSLQLIEDNGDTLWYANGQTSKSGLPVPLQKDLLRTFTYAPPAALTTTTALTAAPNPASVNQTVTYTATVTSNGGTPSGAVAFADGGTAITGCTAQPVNANGVATCAVAYPQSGSHQVTATYAGTAAFATSTSDAVTETVNALATTTTLTASPTQVTAGDDITFTATVTSASGTPTGKVRFATGNGTITGCGSVTLAADGTATCTTSFAQPGDRTVTATYLGTTVFAGSASDPLTVGVAAPIVPTTTTIAASDSSVAIGASVTYTATVSAASGTPTGSVTFSEGGTALTDCDTVALGGDGTATCTTSYQHAGTHQVVAAYAGAATFGASSSDPVTVTVQPTPVTLTADDQTVTFGSGDPTFSYTVTPEVGLQSPPTCDVAGPHTAVGTYVIHCAGAQIDPDHVITYVDGTLTVAKAATSVTVTADPAAPVAAQSVTFTATVSTGGNGTATGSVEFDVAGSALPGCDAAAVNAAGQASCLVDGGFLPGALTVTAVYSGDDSYEGSSGSTTIQVGKADSSTSVSVAPTAPVVGDQVVFTASVSGTGAITATGTVAFTVDGAAVSGCDALAVDGSGTATCTVPGGFAAGDHTVVATYSGDDNLLGSNDTATFTVAKAAATVVVATDPVAPVTGQTITLTATVSAANGTPSGTVTFGVTGGSSCGPVPVDGSGTATCMLTGGLAAGAYTVTAGYSGDAAVAPGTGSTTVTVGTATTSTTLTADSNPLVTGQPVTFTATVGVALPGSGAAGVPTGTVSFDTASGPALPGCDTPVAVDASGSAQCTVTAGFVPSSFTVVAAYSGDANFGASADSLAVTVRKASVLVTVTGTPIPPSSTAATTFHAAVSPVAPAAGTPTGSVVFTVTNTATRAKIACTGGNTVALSNGGADCVIPAGKLTSTTSFTVAVSYGGDTGFAPGTGSFAQTAAAVGTTTTVTSSLNPSPTGAAVTLKAKVVAVSGSGKPSGTVSFTVTGADGTQVACKKSNTAVVSAGVATCGIDVGLLRASNGPYAVTAAYSGSAKNTPSQGSASQQVRPASTKVQLTQSSNSSVQGAPVTFTATVVPGNAGPIGPSGSISFAVVDKKGHAVPCAGGGPVGPNGSAACTVAGADLVAANSAYKITATYSGDSDYATSKVTVSHKVTVR